jgi:hypothetical protein
MFDMSSSVSRFMDAWVQHMRFFMMRSAPPMRLICINRSASGFSGCCNEARDASDCARQIIRIPKHFDYVFVAGPREIGVKLPDAKHQVRLKIRAFDHHEIADAAFVHHSGRFRHRRLHAAGRDCARKAFMAAASFTWRIEASSPALSTAP